MHKIVQIAINVVETCRNACKKIAVEFKKKILMQFPEEDRAIEVDLDNGNLSVIKTLGILWVDEKDIFTYRVNPPNQKHLLTKKNVLRKNAALFNPMGFLNPYIIRAKILLQEIWTSGLEWDDFLEYSQARKAKR